MASLRRFLSVLVLLAAASLLGACAGTLSKAEYERQMGVIGKDVRAAMAELEPTGGHQPSADDIRAAADSLGAAASKMDDIRPPDKVAPAHKRMERGLREMQASFERLAAKFEKAHNDEDRTTVFLEWSQDPDATKARDDISAAQQQFQAAGYTVFRTDTAASSTTE